MMKIIVTFYESALKAIAGRLLGLERGYSQLSLSFLLSLPFFPLLSPPSSPSSESGSEEHRITWSSIYNSMRETINKIVSMKARMVKGYW